MHLDGEMIKCHFIGKHGRYEKNRRLFLFSLHRLMHKDRDSSM